MRRCSLAAAGVPVPTEGGHWGLVALSRRSPLGSPALLSSQHHSRVQLPLGFPPPPPCPLSPGSPVLSQDGSRVEEPPPTSCSLLLSREGHRSLEAAVSLPGESKRYGGERRQMRGSCGLQVRCCGLLYGIDPPGLQVPVLVLLKVLVPGLKANPGSLMGENQESLAPITGQALCLVP